MCSFQSEMLQDENEMLGPSFARGCVPNRFAEQVAGRCGMAWHGVASLIISSGSRKGEGLFCIPSSELWATR